MPERDEFIEKLKGALEDKKLPTSEELTGYTSPFEEESIKKEIEELAKSDTEKKEEERKIEEAKKKAKELYEQGLTIKEISSILRREGYPFKEIEQALLELIREKRKEVKILPEEEIEKVKSEPPTLPKPPTLEEKKIETKEEIFSPEEGEFAPLFIKVERYRQILQNLEELKGFNKNIARLLQISQELEGIRRDNLATLLKMFQKVNEKIESLYSGLLKPSSLKVPGMEARAEITKLDDVLEDLKREITILRDEIEKIKSL